MGRPPQLFLLLVLFTAVFGAGIADVAFSDVIPLRPYSHVFQTDLTTISRAVAGGGLVSDIFGAILIIVLASSLFGTIANFTTGRTIAHAGFTVNPNITASVGMVPVIQLIPFAFGAMVLLMTYAIFERHLPGGL
jgi:hypothetical protein